MPDERSEEGKVRSTGHRVEAAVSHIAFEIRPIADCLSLNSIRDDVDGAMPKSHLVFDCEAYLDRARTTDRFGG
jgi:hypothetical protein